MDPQYHTYFYDRLNEIWAATSERAASLNAGSAVGPDDIAYFTARDGIETVRGIVQEEGGPPLRPDAEFLIYFAFSELVVRPVATVRPDARDELVEDITQDIALITKVAQSQAGEEVSAHDVINAVGQIWGELRSSRWEVWD